MSTSTGTEERRKKLLNKIAEVHFNITIGVYHYMDFREKHLEDLIQTYRRLYENEFSEDRFDFSKAEAANKRYGEWCRKLRAQRGAPW